MHYSSSLEPAVMAEPEAAWVNFRHEYVSGAVELFLLESSSFMLYVANRGATDGVVRGVVWSWHPAGNVHSVRFDGGDQTVAPGEMWIGGFEADSEVDLNSLFWARIYTTSPNLVPSAAARRPSGVDTTAVTDVYFGPGDFAAFELPFRVLPPLPPIPPVAE